MKKLHKSHLELKLEMKEHNLKRYLATQKQFHFVKHLSYKIKQLLKR